MRTAKPFYTFPYGSFFAVQFRDPESGRLLTRVRKYWIPALGSKHLSKLQQVTVC